MSMRELVSEQITCRMITQPALHLMEAQLPADLIDKVNAHIDARRGNANDNASALVGQIRRDKKSAQLQIDREQKIPAALGGVIMQVATEYLRGKNFNAAIKPNDI